MILFVTTSSQGRVCAAALEQGTGQRAHVAGSVPQALQCLRAAEYEVLVVDQSLLEADLRALDTLLNHSAMAMPVYVNLALQSSDRVLREVQVALRRGDTEKQLAMRVAQRMLGNELSSEVTGILLSSELALRQEAIPAGIAEKLKSIRDVAERMRSQLGIS